MPDLIVARKDPRLSARVLREHPMVYADDPSDETGDHPHVRAASGMTFFREYLAIVQDDANWLALVDQDDVPHALPLPRNPGSGTRIFSSRIGSSQFARKAAPLSAPISGSQHTRFRAFMHLAS